MMKVTGKTTIHITVIHSEALIIKEALFRYCGSLVDSNTEMAEHAAKMGYAIQDQLAKKCTR